MKNLTILENSTSIGKMVKVDYRPDDVFIIKHELIGGRFIVLCNDGIEYCFDEDDILIVD